MENESRYQVVNEEVEEVKSAKPLALSWRCGSTMAAIATIPNFSNNNKQNNTPSEGSQSLKRPCYDQTYKRVHIRASVRGPANRGRP